MIFCHTKNSCGKRLLRISNCLIILKNTPGWMHYGTAHKWLSSSWTNLLAGEMLSPHLQVNMTEKGTLFFLTSLFPCLSLGTLAFAFVSLRLGSSSACWASFSEAILVSHP